MASRVLLSVLGFLVLTCSALGQQDLGPAPKVPDYVRWQLPTPEQEMAVAARLRRLLAPGYDGEESLTAGSFILVDPRLWEFLRSDSAIAKLELKTVRSVLPRLGGTIVCEGRAFRDETKALVETLIRERVAADGSLEVRRATTEELDYVWALIPFDIEGTLLTVVTPKRRLIHLTDAKDEMLYLFELPLQVMDVEASLDALAALPLTLSEAGMVTDQLDDPELPLPGVLDSDDIAVVLLTEPRSVAARIEKSALGAYADTIDALLMETVPKNAGRVLVQSSFDAAGKPRIFLRAPSGAAADLKSRIESIPAPRCKGPITIVLVKDR